MSDDVENGAGAGPGSGSGPGSDPDERGDEHADLTLREDRRRPGWLATYGQPLWRVLLLLAMLVGIVILRKPCAEGVAGFVGSFGPPMARATDGGLAPASSPRGLPTGAQDFSGSSRPAARGDAAPRQ